MIFLVVRDINSLSFEELKAEFLSFREQTMKHIQEQDETISTLREQVKKDEININDLELQLRIEKEKNKLLISAKYQSQKVAKTFDMPSLFDDVEAEALKVEADEVEETITVNQHTRIKRPKEKHISFDGLRRVEEILPIPEGEDICEICGSKMKIKKYEIKEQIVRIPADLYVKVIKIPVLECEECQSINEDGKSSYHKVKHNFLFPRSLCSPELLAYIIDMKYNNGLPLYTIEKIFQRENAIIPRQNMANWIIGSIKYLEPLFNIMKKDLIKLPIIQCDETVTQVLRENGKPATSTSFMWVYRSSKLDKPIVLYEYKPTRSGDCAKEFLKGYSGYIETDAYSGYNKVKNTIRCMCNVHSLRKFKDAYKLLPNNENRKNSDEAMAIKKYDEIFHASHKIEEMALKKYSDKEKRLNYITMRRQIELKPKFEEFLSWLKEIQERNIGRHSMSKAIEYVLNNREALMEFTNNAIIPLDNSLCERSIRPFVVIRNRCKFSVSTAGAHVGALIYSLSITCIENHRNPYMYFMYLFENLPNIDLNDENQLRKYLPYSEELPDYLRTLSKSEIKAILSGEKK